MIKAVKKDTGSFVFMRLKKHPCPKCGKIMKRVKMKKTVKSKTKQASKFDFSAANLPLAEKVKFIWYEFSCPTCSLSFSEDALKKIEKEAKENAAKAKNWP